MRMRRVYLSMRTEGIKRFQNGYGVVVWTGENDRKTISVDANLIENGAKQLENGLVWTKPKAKFRCRTSHVPIRMQMRKILCSPLLAFDSAHVKYGV